MRCKHCRAVVDGSNHYCAVTGERYERGLDDFLVSAAVGAVVGGVAGAILGTLVGGDLLGGLLGGLLGDD